MENKTEIKTQIKLYQTIIKDYLKIEVKSLILPILINDNTKVIEIQNLLKQKGYLIGAIRQPTVQKAILRIILKLDISQTNLKNLCVLIAKL
jgi:8-amino-7-oxononanoate synthase